MAGILKRPITECLDAESEEGQELLKGSEDFTEMDWMKILDHNPHLLARPIAIRGEKAILYHSPSEILKL